MTYESFKQKLITDLQAHFPADASIAIQQFHHNNHILLDGLTILEPGSNISPTIYLNQYYADCQEGTPYSAIQERILRYYYSHSAIQKIDTSFFTCFDHVRSRIVYKLVHLEKNKELLKKVPYFPYLDLAIVFYCLVQEAPYQNGMILIHNEHLAYWDADADTLLSLAHKNTPVLLPFCCDSLADLLLPALDDLSLEECGLTKENLESEAVPMYVLTNRQRQNGAGCLLYQGALEQVADILKGSFYILPSSIHEVIAVPAAVADDPQELSQIVKEINLTEVLPEEVLSDRIYYFDSQSCSLSVC